MCESTQYPLVLMKRHKSNAIVNSAMEKVGVAGKVFIAAGIAQSAYNIAIAEDKSRAVVQEGGGWAGAIAGGEAGAEIGAAIGVWFGGAGAVPGAFIGSIIGSGIGCYIGSGTGDYVYATISQ